LLLARQAKHHGQTGAVAVGQCNPASGRLDIAVADNRADRSSATCDLYAFRCIYSIVTASSFQFDLPQSLLDRARAGELGAFEQIYRRFERPVYTLALRMLGDAEAARDVLHDAMLKVFQRIDQYRADAPFWAWLRQIALNEALMRLRRAPWYESDIDVEAIVDDAAPTWVHADASALERALDALPALTRSVLWMYHVEGYSHAEIAELVGKTTSFSKSQVARGTARLRAMLDPPLEQVSCLIGTPQAG
jgi:RNA polymerase sigma factor (sigma-70 family)